jgi:hypothetical protein
MLAALRNAFALFSADRTTGSPPPPNFCLSHVSCARSPRDAVAAFSREIFFCFSRSCRSGIVKMRNPATIEREDSGFRIQHSAFPIQAGKRRLWPNRRSEVGRVLWQFAKFGLPQPGEGGGALVVRASRPNKSAAGQEAPAAMICLICLISLNSSSKSLRIREHIKGRAVSGWLDMFDIFGSPRCAK